MGAEEENTFLWSVLSALAYKNGGKLEINLAENLDTLAGLKASLHYNPFTAIAVVSLGSPTDQAIN